MLVFSNPGEIDTRLITTLGTNVKTTDHPIGQFGTGLKYALAILLRRGCQIVVCSGMRKFEFKTTPEIIRGKSFDMIDMHEHNLLNARPEVTRLGFTTELGAKWQLWMAYRELRSNCQDESGMISSMSDSAEISREPGYTKILVWGIDNWHENSGMIFLDQLDKPLWEGSNLEIRSGQSESIFYQGIRVKKLDKPSLYTYNITTHMALTEDRTLEGTWYLNYYLAGAILGIEDDAIREAVITAQSDFFESTLDFTSAARGPNKAFFETVAAVKVPITASASRVYAEQVHNHFEPAEITLDPDDQTRFEAIRTKLSQWMDLPEIKFVDKLGPKDIFDVGGEYGNQHARIARAALDDDFEATVLLAAVCAFRDLGAEDSPLARELARMMLSR